MNPGAPKRPRGAGKRPRVRTCPRNLLPKPVTTQALEAETVLWKQFFTCFLILPDEFIDNQIDNLAITKNCQKGPRAARDPIQPGVAHFNFASMS